MFGIARHMPTRREFWYAVVNDYRDSDPYRYRMGSVFSDPEDQAVDAGEDYYNNHDGWEARWPLTFAIYESESGPEVGRFVVEMEAVPQFTASPVEAQDATK